MLNEEFDQEHPEPVAASTCCDMTASLDGHLLDVDVRLMEIHSRYGPEHLVSRSIANATPCVTSAVRADQAAAEQRRGLVGRHADLIASDDMTTFSGCYTCDQEAQFDTLPPRERIAFDDHWRVAHAIGTALPGWLVLVPRRHVTTVAHLSDAEASTLGLWQVRLSRALREATGCVKTYVVQFAELEGFNHVHFHVVPRMRDLPEDLRGPRVFGLMGRTGADGVQADQMDEMAVTLGRLL
ncbi:MULTISPECIES: HIT family protein [Streptosporangium]|uniref:Diadenosine tetraphosphate (Ap4A) HIT family hydrolase n=1 Tax=Streptosporangium brasiliense TaxID=47480 RepID=A0ABT9R6I5_9ACTN|nr:HIT family protein [Streptosporangium brasiliense]MDP9864852.1 diadenosine tetraphosphate (Ap4A) HIT family hydrolase [Streptosporangium brasiliense]